MLATCAGVSAGLPLIFYILFVIGLGTLSGFLQISSRPNESASRYYYHDDSAGELKSLPYPKNNVLFNAIIFLISKNVTNYLTMGGKEEIISAMEQFESVQEKYLPKVDRRLVIDLFLRLREEPNVQPMYTVETFIEEGTNVEEIRNEVMRMTGTAPQFHDRGTHLVAHHKLDYDLLKQIQDHPSVIEVKGNYTGSDASIGATHEFSTAAGRKESPSRSY